MKPVIYIILFFFVLGCSNKNEEQLSDLKMELKQTKDELKSCSTELANLKNTAENRFIKANKFLSENQLDEAKLEFQGIAENFEGSADAEKAKIEITKINKQIEKERKEEERKKALGYKILKPNSKVKFGDLSLRFDKIYKGKRWIFDDYGSEYFYRDAERGKTHILARVSITSKTTDPQLPPIIVYKMDNGELKLIEMLEYKFRQWSDYGSYLGNYADYGNDFSHSKTIPFNCGIELSKNKLKRGKIYIVLKKIECFERYELNSGNPEVRYSNTLSCNPKQILKVEDFEKDYELLKIL